MHRMHIDTSSVCVCVCACVDVCVFVFLNSFLKGVRKVCQGDLQELLGRSRMTFCHTHTPMHTEPDGSFTFNYEQTWCERDNPPSFPPSWRLPPSPQVFSVLGIYLLDSRVQDEMFQLIPAILSSEIFCTYSQTSPGLPACLSVETCVMSVNVCVYGSESRADLLVIIM